jgi:sugar phosphate permease
MASSGRVPVAARFLPKRLFYGWYVAIACSLVMMVGVGVGYYGLAVFLRPLSEEHGWSTTAVSGATGMYFAISGLSAAVIGPRIDRNGPILYMVIGLIATSIAVSLIGFVDQLWQLYLVYAALAVAFGMSSAVAVNAIMTRWFVRRRAKALSVSSTGISVGGVILAPVGTWLVEWKGIEVAAPFMGILVLVIALPMVVFVLAWDPSDLGLKPDGDLEGDIEEDSLLSDEVQLRSWTTHEVMRTLAFWGILVAFVLVLVAQTGYVLHQIAFLEDRFESRNTAALALSLTAFGSIVARLIVGMFADSIDKRWLTVVLFLVQGTAVLTITLVDNIPLTWVMTLIFGFTIGNIYMMQSLLVGEIFGLVSFGAVFGLVSFAGQVGSGGGPFLVGVLEDSSGSYTLPFLVTAGITYFAAFAIAFIRPIALPKPDVALSPEVAHAPAGGE